jgi:hypothetical protein
MSSGDSGGDLHRKPEPGFYEELHRLEKQAGTATTSGGLLPPIPTGIVVVVLAVLGVLGVALLRDRETEDGPQDVLNAYVQSTLSANDDRAVAELTCRTPHLDSIRSWQQDLMNRRQRLNLPPLQAGVAAYRDTTTDQAVTATAEVTVTLTVNGQPQERLVRPYTFTLTHEDGWKVCTATQTT